jgi:hypothetical protein
MTLNKVPYNEHRAQDPCHCGPQNSLFFGALLNYGKMTVLQVLYGASCSTTDTRTEFDVSFEIDQPELEQVSVSQYETHTSDQNTCYLHPCHCGPQNSLFFGALLNYGKMTVLQNTQLFNQLNIIHSFL